MAKVSEWVDPSTVGGLTEGQEEEIANLVSKSFGSSRIGLLKKAAALGKIKKFMGLPVGFEPDAKAIAEYIQSFPYQGQYQKQDIGAIYSSLSDKYGGGAFKLLGDPPTAEEVYSKIMFFSPESVSRSKIKATGLDSYGGPIAETIEWEEPSLKERVPKMAKGGLINGTKDNPGVAIVGEDGAELVVGNAAVVPLPDMDLNYDLTPLYQTEYGDSLYPTGYNYNLEETTTKKLGYTPRYGNNALLQLKAKNALIKLQEKFFREYGKNFEIESAYRNKEPAAGGSNLNHPRGTAFDVKFSLLSDTEKKKLKELGRSVGLYYATGTTSHFNYR